MQQSIDDIRTLLAEFLDAEGASLGMGQGDFDLTYVPNPGGFVNPNFTARSPHGTWHCKLAYPDSQPGIRRWYQLGDLLSQRYRSPRVLTWIDIESADLGGVIVEYVPGVHASYERDARHWSSVSTRVQQLHGDGELGAILSRTDTVGSCLQYLEDTYLEMLTEDVEATRVHAETPPFVGPEFWDWATEQAAQIRAVAAGMDEFHQPADAVVHGDLWEGNVLTAAHDWWIVDWDELGFGDPAKDLTDWWRQTPTPPHSASQAVHARLPLWTRLRLLVDAVDTLADWSEAIVAPTGLRQEMRADSRRIHQTSLAAYRQVYGAT